MPGGNPILTILPLLLSIVALIAVSLVLTSGVNNVLSELYYLKTDPSNLNLPAALSESTFLKDLSEVSGTDLVGSDVTAGSLQLAQSYTISLLTFCARYPDSAKPGCSKPSFRFWFDPGQELRLDATSISESYSDEYKSALRAYDKTSGFIAAAFLITVLGLGLSTILTLVGACCSESSAPTVAAAVFSSLSAVLLLAANAAAAYIFRRLNNAINANFNKIGVSSLLGVGALVLGWVAFILSLAVSVMLIIRSRSASGSASIHRGSRRTRGGDPLVTGGKSAHMTGQQAIPAGPRGLLGRLPTWKKHQYVQVENQPTLGQSNYPSMEPQNAVTAPLRSNERAMNEDRMADDEYARLRYGDGGNGQAVGIGGGGIALRNMSGGSPQPQRNMNTAYEPYSNAQ